MTALGLQALAPTDADLQRSPEVPSRKIVEDRSQIVMAAFGVELALRATSGNELAPMALDKAVDDGGSPRTSPPEVVPHGRQNVLICGQEHVVESHLEPPASGLCGQHRTAVVGDHEPNRLTESLGQHQAPARGARIRAVEIVLWTLGLRSVGDRFAVTRKLKGKLEHLALG